MEKHEVAWQLWKQFLSNPENKLDLAKMTKKEAIIFMTACLGGIQDAIAAIESGELRVSMNPDPFLSGL
jgi:hypothetical protein